MTPQTLSRLEVMTLLGLEGDSWTSWRAAAKVLDGAPLTPKEQAIYEQCTGRTRLPSEPPNEAFFIVGRRGGKSRFGGALVVHAAGFRPYALAPGEKGVVAVAASDREQARIALGYSVVPFTEDAALRELVRPRSAWDSLRGLVTRQTRWGVDLRSGVSIEVRTAHFGSIRGRSFALVLADEAAYWQREDGSNPASEVLGAVRPGLVTLNGQLVVISTPYAKSGPVWDAFERYWGKDDDRVLVWKAPSRSMNPLIAEHVIEDALERDEASARSEWLAEFRSDLESFISRELIARVVVPGRRELPPRPGEGDYLGFVDAATGAGQDAMTLAIVHVEQEEAGGPLVVVLDAIREAKPPFNPSPVVGDFAATGRSYALGEVHGDRFAGGGRAGELGMGWVAEAFQAQGLGYRVCPFTKSELYRDLMPLITTGSIELLDHPALVSQLHGLERRVGGSGRDAIDHGRAGHDDLINAVAGAVVLARAEAARPELRLVVLG